MNDFVKRARKTAPSRHAVRDAVGECLPDIRAGRESGLSWAVIYGQLRRDGKAVGKGPSSLQNAVRYWDGSIGAASSGGKPAVSTSAINAQIAKEEKVHAGPAGAAAPSTFRANDHLAGTSIQIPVEDDDEDFKVRRAPRD